MGRAVAAVAIPSAIAYPAIAALPAGVEIYSSIVPLVGYALLGPSRPLVVGPAASPRIYENLAESLAAFVTLACIQIAVRRLAR